VSRPRAVCSLLAVALLSCAPVPEARAAESAGPRDASEFLSDGFHFVLRALGLARDTSVLSHAVSLSQREATVELRLDNGALRSVSLRAGEVLVDGTHVGRYRVGGALDRAWRRVLTDGASSDSRALLGALRSFSVAGLAGDDGEAERRLSAAFRNLVAVQQPPPAASSVEAAAMAAAVAAQGLGVSISDSVVRALTMADISALDSLARALEAIPDLGPEVIRKASHSPLHPGFTTVPPDEVVRGSLVVFRGNADVYGTVAGDVVALLGDVICHRGGLIEGDAVAVGGRVIEAGGTIRGDIRALSSATGAVPARARAETSGYTLDSLFKDVGTIVAVFIAMAMSGFGMVFFGRRYVEVMADTATHSFGRSFVVGLLGQVLLLPTLAMLIVGLALTIVGILLLPFAVVAYVLGAALALLGGYLAVAHAVGETFTRRRMANGAFVSSPNSYGYVFTGLVGLLGLWAAAALVGWSGPVVLIFRLAAVLVTWVAATTGFGAVLLSRAGLRETFAGRYTGEMTDEYLWATPPATPTAARTGRQT